MRKNNIVVFALLSVLSVGGISAAILANTELRNDLVTAKTSSPCTLTWTAAKPAQISNGSGTGLADGGTVTTVYEGAEAVSGHHVKLTSTGSMKSSNLAWDGQTGGVVNCIESVRVVFEKDSDAFYDDLWGVDSESSTLIFTDSSGETKTKLKSGQTYTFEKYLPSDFIIKLENNGSPTFSDCWAKITSVEIGCDHLHKTYTLSYDETAMITDPDFKFGSSTSDYKISNEDYAFDNRNYRSGDIGVLIPQNEEFVCSADSLEITGASKVEYKEITYSNKKVVAAFFTVGNSDIAIKVKAWEAEPPQDPYPADQYAFVGTYNLYHPETEDNVAVELKSDGTYTIGTATGTYKAVDSKNVTFDNPKNQDRPVKFTLYDDGFAHLGYALHNALGNVDASLIGYKTPKAPIVNKGLVLSSSPWQSYLAEFSDGVSEHQIFVHKGTVLVNGVKGVQAVPDNPDLLAAEIIKIQQTLPKATPDADFDLPTDLDVFYEVVGETKVATTYIRNSGGKFTYTKPDTRILGTYTCEGSPDLVLDGFYHYTLGSESGSFEVDKWSPVIFTLGKIRYTLNESDHTYTAVEVVADPTLGETTKVYKEQSGTYTLTFDGKGKVTDGYTGETIKYKYDNMIYKCSVNFLPEEFVPPMCYSASLDFEFTINPTGTAITLTKYVITGTDDYGGTEEKPLTTPLILTLQA